MKGYELLYIVGTQYTDEEIGKIQESTNKLLEDAGAKILRNENLGKIRLAYPINKIRHGSYILVHFDAEPTALADLNRRFGLADEMLRHTILERPADALERKYEIISYVAPLSEEARAERDNKRAPKSSAKKVEKAEEPALAPPTPASAEEASMSIEELDQKLDKILEGDIEEKL